MARDILAMEDVYYGRLHDKWDEAHEPGEHERPDYNPKERRYALDNLLEFVEGDIECMEDYSRSASPEKKQVYWEYEGLLSTLRDYAEMLRKDRFDADCLYNEDQSYWDSLE